MSDPAKQDEIEELKDLVRQMHEALKDGARLLKAMATVKEELLSVSQQVFDERMSEMVAEGLSEYRKALNSQIELASKSIYDRFDTIADILTGKDKDLDFNRITVMQIGDEGHLYEVTKKGR